MWIHLLMTTILAFATSTSQTIQIYDLTRNPGLLTIQTGNALINTGRHRIYHTIDLKDYGPLLENIANAVEGLKIFTDFSDINIILGTKLANAFSSYNRLMPTKRYKRGAFNFLGSGIKIITGNLDDNDLIQINRDINQLRQNNMQLVTQNNIQITVNKQLQKRINQIIDSVNNQQKIIRQQIIAARQTLINDKMVNHNVTIIRQAFKISSHLDLIQNHLDSIFEVIQLAKINIISRNFLEADELKFIVNRLEEQNITILNTDQAFSYLDIRALFKETVLYFIIGVPQISSHPFNSLLLEPLPINGKVIKLPTQKAITNGNLTYFIKDNCQNIGENVLCDENDLQDVSEDDCFSKIIQGLHGKCSSTNYHNTTNIKRLTDNHIIIKNSSVSLITNCLNSKRILSGTVLIFFANCTISLNGMNYSTTAFYTKALPTISPLDGIKIEQSRFEPELDIHTLHKLHIQNRDMLQIHYNQHSFQTSMSLGISSTCIILGLSFVLYAWYKKRTSPDRKDVNINIQNSTDVIDNHATNRDDSSSKGGAVKITSFTIPNMLTPQPTTATTTKPTTTIAPIIARPSLERSTPASAILYPATSPRHTSANISK